AVRIPRPTSADADLADTGLSSSAPRFLHGRSAASAWPPGACRVPLLCSRGSTEIAAAAPASALPWRLYQRLDEYGRSDPANPARPLPAPRLLAKSAAHRSGECRKTVGCFVRDHRKT